MGIETIDEKITRLNKESTRLENFNLSYQNIFQKEKKHLQSVLPREILKRVEHFGSTAIVGIWSKPIIDILVEVVSLDDIKRKWSMVFEEMGYDYLWRPSTGGIDPYYAWFIKRDAAGNRTHHIHMIEKGFKMWDRLLFRDYLNEFPNIAKKYEKLKLELANDYPDRRDKYTDGKSSFVLKITKEACEYYI